MIKSNKKKVGIYVIKHNDLKLLYIIVLFFYIDFVRGGMRQWVILIIPNVFSSNFLDCKTTDYILPYYVGKYHDTVLSSPFGTKPTSTQINLNDTIKLSYYLYARKSRAFILNLYNLK